MAISAISGQIKPSGAPGCDFNPLDRTINVITSLPYVAVGYHNVRKRHTFAGKAFGLGVMCCGVAAAVFHATPPGKLRQFTRRVDYWTIAVTATCLTRAVYQNVHPFITTLSYCLVPFEPFKLSMGNTMYVEFAYLQRALQKKHMMKAFIRHAACRYVSLPSLLTCNVSSSFMGHIRHIRIRLSPSITSDGDPILLLLLIRFRRRLPSIFHARRSTTRCLLYCSVVGLACFIVEDTQPQMPYIHSVWHCLAAVGAASMGALLEDVEGDLASQWGKGRKSIDSKFPVPPSTYATPRGSPTPASGPLA
jgi:hypothetical protein